MSRQVHALRAIPVLAGLIGTCVLFRSAPAEVAAPDATRPAPLPNNWWDVPPQAAPRPAAGPQGQNEPSVFRHDGPNPYSITDYPTAQMGDWVMASSMAARARAMLLRAQSELNLSIRRVQQRFEHSEEFTRAAIDEKQAYSAYIAARQQVLGALGNDAKYHAIMQLRDELSQKISARRFARDDARDIDLWLASHGFDRTKLTGDQMTTLKAMFDAEQQKAANNDASREDVLALATLKMQYASDARAIEVSALEADENLKSARQRMVTASRRVSDLRAQFDYNLHDNPEVLLARRNLEDARVAVIEAQALACSAGVASSYALNYSYYLHRNDNSGLYGPYGGAVVTSGYTTPYWGR